MQKEATGVRQLHGTQTPCRAQRVETQCRGVLRPQHDLLLTDPPDRRLAVREQDTIGEHPGVVEEPVDTLCLAPRFRRLYERCIRIFRQRRYNPDEALCQPLVAKLRSTTLVHGPRHVRNSLPLPERPLRHAVCQCLAPRRYLTC